MNGDGFNKTSREALLRRLHRGCVKDDLVFGIVFMVQTGSSSKLVADLLLLAFATIGERISCASRPIDLFELGGASSIFIVVEYTGCECVSAKKCKGLFPIENQEGSYI